MFLPRVRGGILKGCLAAFLAAVTVAFGMLSSRALPLIAWPASVLFLLLPTSIRAQMSEVVAFYAGLFSAATVWFLGYAVLLSIVSMLRKQARR
jgi:hypothetical protein